jgi:hypothetical protein
MLRGPRLVGAALAAALSAGAGAGVASAYEFHVDAQSTAQGYQVRWLRGNEEDRLLNRRRFTQTLGLDVWNILDPGVDPDHPDRPRRAPFQLYFTSQLRLDHDFGGYLGGNVDYLQQGVIVTDPATQLVPELAFQNRALDVLWAYLGGRGLMGGVLDFKLGRQLEVESMDWYAFDGLELTFHTPWHVALTAHGGLLDRSASLWGSPTRDPDGTSGALCTHVEAGGDAWIPADDCPQRDALMPGFGLALEAEHVRHLRARLAWRRAMSPTGSEFPSSAPGWGVNEEKLTASVGADGLGGGVVADAGVRWNLALGQLDEARAGVRLGWAALSLTPVVAYVAPSFDADSIFNVFASDPFTDVRLGAELWPGRGRVRLFARGDYRRFDADDSWGGAIGGAYKGTRGRGRVELYGEQGFGGKRLGGDASLRWRLRHGPDLDARVTVLKFDDDELSELHAVTVGAQGGARWTLGPGTAVYLLVEENSNRFDRSQLRLMGVLDLAYVPEI